MSERKASRFALLGLSAAILVGALGYFLTNPEQSVASQALDQAGVTFCRSASSESISFHDRPTVSSWPIEVAWLVIESRS